MQLFSGRRTEQGIRQRAMMARERERIDQERQGIDTYRVFATSASMTFPMAEKWPPVTLRKSTFQRIEERACKAFGVTMAALKSHRRDKQLVMARQFVVYWTVRLTSLTLPQIGRLMKRDHTTCLHGRDAYPKKRAKMGRNLRSAR